MTIDIGEAADATNSVAHCPDWLVRLLEIVQTISDLVGLTAICGALLIAAGRWLFHEAKLIKNRGDRMERWMGIRDIRLFLGNYILFGLEFMIVSDIIHSFLQPDLQSLSRLGLLVLIRTLISFFLGKELEIVRTEEEAETT